MTDKAETTRAVLDVPKFLRRPDPPRSDLDRLHDYFGGPDAFRAVSRGLSEWGRVNLPEAIYEFCGSSFEGVLAMHAAREAANGKR